MTLMDCLINPVIKATFPLGVRKPNGKWIPFSGSWYRNAYFHESNKVKVHYTETLAALQLKNHSPMVGVVYSLFVVFKPNKRRLDTDNYTTVHKKFFNDAMVKYGIIEDDDSETAALQISCYGGIDKDNPRVDIYVTQDLEKIIELMRENLWKIH